MTDYEAALERAKKMKAMIPDATVKGLGRVRDLTEEALASWICHGQNDQAHSRDRTPAAPAHVSSRMSQPKRGVDGAGVEPLTARPGAVDLRIRGQK